MTERRHVLGLLAAASFLSISPVRAGNLSGGTGDLGLIVERATGSLLVVDRSERAAVGRIEGLGDLSHASLTYSPDERYAYVFGRDGGLTKVDIIACAIAKRVVQAGNAIGGAISDDGRLVAVSNYEPGGIRVFDAASLEPVANIPSGAKTIGLADLPGRRFIWSQWESAMPGSPTFRAKLSAFLALATSDGIPSMASSRKMGRSILLGSLAKRA